MTKYLTPEERAASFARTCPRYAPLVVHNGALYGCWLAGACYRKAPRQKAFYGAFPHSVLKRIYALFPDCRKVLHLFSGTIEQTLIADEVTYDSNPDLHPTI